MNTAQQTERLNKPQPQCIQFYFSSLCSLTYLFLLDLIWRIIMFPSLMNACRNPSALDYRWLQIISHTHLNQNSTLKRHQWNIENFLSFWASDDPQQRLMGLRRTLFFIHQNNSSVTHVSHTNTRAGAQTARDDQSLIMNMFSVVCVCVCLACRSSTPWSPVRCSSWRTAPAAIRTSPWRVTTASPAPVRRPRTSSSRPHVCCTSTTCRPASARTTCSGWDSPITWLTDPASANQTPPSDWSVESSSITRVLLFYFLLER